MTLPASRAPSGPALSNSTAFGLPSSRAATRASGTASATVSTSPASAKRSTSRASRNRSKSTLATVSGMAVSSLSGGCAPF